MLVYAAVAALAGGYLILAVTAGRVLPVERVLPAGRAALAEWASPAQARTAQADRVAVALGHSPDVAARFLPDGDRPWSSVGGWWHQIGVGDHRPPKTGRPRGTTDIEGQVVRRWVEVIPGGEGDTHEYFVAIDDGRSDLARAAQCWKPLYKRARPGLTVHAQVNLRRNTLTRLSVRETGASWLRPSSRL